MHLAEPRLYWRVKQTDGQWKFVPARIERNPFGTIIRVIAPDPPEVAESE